jgi:putative two-component system response regulator
MELAGFLGLAEEARFVLFKAGVLHDIGKIGVDNLLLHKNENLCPDELKAIQEHVLIGETICFPLNSARQMLPVIRHHHERWDGNGFPDRLTGEEIPLFARITAITDSFDAMVSIRPYRKSYTVAEAIGMMRGEKFSGQWDPSLIDGFIEMMKTRRSVSYDS